MMSHGKRQPRARRPEASSPRRVGLGRAGPFEEARGEQPRARSPWASSPGARSPGASLEAQGEQGHYPFCVSSPSELAREFLSRYPRVCQCL